MSRVYLSTSQRISIGFNAGLIIHRLIIITCIGQSLHLPFHICICAATTSNTRYNEIEGWPVVTMLEFGPRCPTVFVFPFLLTAIFKHWGRNLGIFFRTIYV